MLDGDGRLTPRPCHFTGRKETRYSLYRRPSASQGRSGRVRKTSPSPGFDPRIIQPVASRYTDHAIPAYPIILTEVYVIIFSRSLKIQEQCREWDVSKCLLVPSNSYSLHTGGVTATRLHVTGAVRAVCILSTSVQCCYRTFHFINKDMVLA